MPTAAVAANRLMFCMFCMMVPLLVIDDGRPDQSLDPAFRLGVLAIT
jgi:hypothetical protein